MGVGVQVHKERVVGPRMSLSCPCSAPVPGWEPHLGVLVARAGWSLPESEPVLRPPTEPPILTPSFVSKTR